MHVLNVHCYTPMLCNPSFTRLFCGEHCYTPMLCNSGFTRVFSGEHSQSIINGMLLQERHML